MFGGGHKVRVLHLPTNIASQMSVTVRALRDIHVEARGLVRGNSAICDGAAIENYELVSRRRHPVRGTLQTLSWWQAVVSAIRWADVIHWHFASSALPFDLGMRYAARLRKPRIVEFWGSDIRIPEIASTDNPYIARMYEKHPEFGRVCG